MAPYIPPAAAAVAGMRGRVTSEEVSEALGQAVRSLLRASRSASSPLPPVSVACIRLAAAHRPALRASRPDVWRDLECFYRQHLRPTMTPGEARHWNGALRMPE